MSFSYTVRESLSGFTRTKLSSIVSIITICISLILLGLFAILTVNAARFVEALRSKVELEAFLHEPVQEATVDSLIRVTLDIEGVESVTYVTKEEAARVFREEFGEDITTVLDFNPLPPSFRIALQPAYKTAEGAQKVNDQLKAIDGIESIVYRKALIELIDQRTRSVNRLTLGLGILISLSAIVLVSNTIRLAIYAKRKLIQTMELVGATPGFIRLPFLLEGILQGVVGGILAAIVLYVLIVHAVPLASSDLPQFVHMPHLFYLLVIAAGTALGLIGSTISVARFIRTA